MIIRTFSFSPSQCVDLSCNELTEVTLPETLPPKLLELDLTGNPRLNLDHKSLELLKYEPWNINTMQQELPHGKADWVI